MSEKKPTREQRKWFRCAVAKSCRSCELKIDSNVLPATLVDESAGGFSVLVGRPPGLFVGQTADLHTYVGRFRVRVVNIVRARPPKDIVTTPAAKQNPWVRLGLSRLGESGVPDPPRISLFARSLRFRLSTWCPSGGNGKWAIVGLLFAFFAIVMLSGLMWGLMGMSRRPGQAQVAQLPPWSDRLIRWVAPGRPQPSPAPPVASPPPADTPPVSRETTAFSPLNEQELHNLVRRLPGAATLAIPGVIQKLQLTDTQQKRIDQLIEATAQAMRDLNARLQGRQRHEISRRQMELLDDAQRKALQVLTEEQRAQWEALIANEQRAVAPLPSRSMETP
jgi:hypothetical protein